MEKPYLEAYNQFRGFNKILKALNDKNYIKASKLGVVIDKY